MNPTDRASGSRYHLLADAIGLPLDIAVSGANRHDSMLVAPILDSMPALKRGGRGQACVLYAVEQLGDVSGRTVEVIGQGPIGLLFSHVLKAGTVLPRRSRRGRLSPEGDACRRLRSCRLPMS